jgi:hypothetical protein
MFDLLAPFQEGWKLSKGHQLAFGTMPMVGHGNSWNHFKGDVFYATFFTAIKINLNKFEFFCL